MTVLRTILVLFLLLAALLSLRFGGLEARPPEPGETRDIVFAAQPLPVMLAHYTNLPSGTYNPPPLHYLLLHTVLRAKAELLPAARAWSAWWAVAAGAAIAVAGYRRLPFAVLLALLLFFILHPLQQHFAQQANACSFLQFCSVISYSLLARLAQNPSPAAAFLLLLALTAGLYSSYCFLPVWAVVALLAAWLRPWQPPRRHLPLLAGVLLALLLFLPWISAFALAPGSAAGDTARALSPATLKRGLEVLLLGTVLPENPLNVGLEFVGMAGAGVLLLLALPELKLRPWLALPALFPPLVLLLSGWYVSPFAPRCLFMAHAPLLLVLALPLGGNNRRAAMLAAGCYALALLAGLQS